MAKSTPGTELMNQLFANGIQKAVPEVVEAVRERVSDALEELLEIGARIRPLMVGDQRMAWVRGLHVDERKLLGRWYTGNEFVTRCLALATSLSEDEIAHLTSREIFSLTALIRDMTDYDLSLVPYISAFVTTSMSEKLWHSHEHNLSSFKNKVVAMPDGSEMKLLLPPDHAKLWATLCTYREQAKVRLDDMMNSAMIVRVWAGNSVDPFLNSLRVNARLLQVDSSAAWENIVSTQAVDVHDGWGHPDDTKEGLLRELRGMLSHDKHEQVMDALWRQQVAEAEADAARIEALHKERGGPGVSQDAITILTPQQVREREKALKKGRPTPHRVTEMDEGGPAPRDRILRYK